LESGVEPTKQPTSYANPSTIPIRTPTPTAGLQSSPTATPIPVPTSTPPPEASEGEWLIVARISEQTLYLYNGHELFHRYPVSTGKATTPTPPGQWRISEKIELQLGTEFGSRWMRLERYDPATEQYQWSDYGIHGTNEEDKIGTPVSAGCIRLRNTDVENLYGLVPLGTLVLITE